MGDVADMTAAFDGLAVQHVADIALRIGMDSFGVRRKGARRDGVDRDAVGPELARPGPGQTDQRAL
ncbi:hypothetical protein D3C72_2462190 [compost metagenome]